MIETRVWCDKCSILITEDRAMIAITTGPKRALQPAFDLCAACLEEFLAWVRAKDPIPPVEGD